MKKSEKTSNKSVRPVPKGFNTVTPYLIAEGAEKFIDFIKDAFDGEQVFVAKLDDGKIMHASVKIGDSMLMISDAMQGMDAEPTMLYLYVDNVDSVYRQAIEAKATSVREPKNEFYGDRAAAVKDKWNNTWWIATHVEDVSDNELQRRAKEARKQPVEA